MRAWGLGAVGSVGSGYNDALVGFRVADLGSEWRQLWWRSLDDGVRGGVAGNCEWRTGLSSSQSCAQVCVGVINTSRVITLGVVVCDTVCSRAGGGVRGVVVHGATWGVGWGVWPP